MTARITTGSATFDVRAGSRLYEVDVDHGEDRDGRAGWYWSVYEGPLCEVAAEGEARTYAVALRQALRACEVTP